MNRLNQPVGPVIAGWNPPPVPPRAELVGRTCRLEPLDPARHAADLHAAYSLDGAGRNWTYLGYGPFASASDYRAWVEHSCAAADLQFYAVVAPATQRAVGVASYLRMAPASGSIEVGHLNYSPLLQRTVAATEAMALMMEQAFALGYRRYEWKCDALNAPSRAAARRLGFTFEGIFRQATVVKGRNRDTAWYSVIDKEWPALQATFTRWLAPSNFDDQGQQRVPLSTLRGQVNHDRTG